MAMKIFRAWAASTRGDRLRVAAICVGGLLVAVIVFIAAFSIGASPKSASNPAHHRHAHHRSASATTPSSVPAESTTTEPTTSDTTPLGTQSHLSLPTPVTTGSQPGGTKTSGHPTRTDRHHHDKKAKH